MSSKTSTSADSDRLLKHFINYENFLKKSKRDFELKTQMHMKERGCLDDFRIIESLGTGSFGKVILCKHKTNQNYYAIKMMEKLSIIKTKQLSHTITEIRLLDAFNFPFIVSSSYFFKNNVYIFIVMDFVNGGEMFHHLRELKKFDENTCKFYAAQVILSLEYMHYMGVVYRDLKPENVLIDMDGYLKVTDLGFCKKIDNQRTYTLCGTPEYLAPEIILSQGYNYSVDWWSLGVLIYEMAAGFPPFYAREHMRLYEKIIAGKFSFPPHFSKSLKDLLQNMLQVDRSKRYGMLKTGVKDIKRHEWFKNTDFDKILNRKVKAPIIPSVKDPGDTKFFDGFGEITIRTSDTNEFEEEFEDFSLPT